MSSVENLWEYSLVITEEIGASTQPYKCTEQFTETQCDFLASVISMVVFWTIIGDVKEKQRYRSLLLETLRILETKENGVFNFSTYADLLKAIEEKTEGLQHILSPKEVQVAIVKSKQFKEHVQDFLANIVGGSAKIYPEGVRFWQRVNNDFVTYLWEICMKKTLVFASFEECIELELQHCKVYQLVICMYIFWCVMGLILATDEAEEFIAYSKKVFVDFTHGNSSIRRINIVEEFEHIDKVILDIYHETFPSVSKYEAIPELPPINVEKLAESTLEFMNDIRNLLLIPNFKAVFKNFRETSVVERARNGADKMVELLEFLPNKQEQKEDKQKLSIILKEGRKTLGFNMLTLAFGLTIVVSLFFKNK